MKALMWVLVIWLSLVVMVRLAHCDLGVSDFDARLIRFNNVWSSYYRKHFNCPSDALKLTECRVDSNSIDYTGFAHVAHEGMKLFAPAESK